jgi:hypothetical protein
MDPETLAEKLRDVVSKSDFLTIAEASNVCPFSTFVGSGAFAGHDSDVMASYAGAVLALIETEPGAIAPDLMAQIQTTLLEGRTVLVMAPTREVRDHARREILAWYDGPRGAAS